MLFAGFGFLMTFVKKYQVRVFSNSYVRFGCNTQLLTYNLHARTSK